MRRFWLIATLGVCVTFVDCSSNSISLSVPPASLKSIAITAANPDIIVNQTEQLTATGTYTDNSTKDLTSSVTWSSSNSALAAISSGGTLTAKSSGKVTITASINSVSDSVDLTITP